MSQLQYTIVEGKYVPVNVKAAGLKCFTCGDQVSPDQLSNHLHSHVNPRFNQPGSSESAPKKIALSKVLSEQTEDDEDLVVKSMLPENLPETDSKRTRVGVLLKDSKEDVDHEITASEFSVNSNAQEELKSRMVIDETEQYQEQPEELNCLSKVKFASQKATIPKKSIRVYESENAGEQVDYGGSESRQRHVPGTEKKQYLIKKADITEETEHSDRMTVSTYNISTRRKDPVTTARISTFALQEKTLKHHKHHDDPTKMSFSTAMPFSPVKQREIESEDEHEGHQRFMCDSCKGFYCRSCKSTIPPMFRPVPDEKGKYHVHPEALEFYQKHVYGHDDKICKNCEGLKYNQ